VAGDVLPGPVGAVVNSTVDAVASRGVQVVEQKAESVAGSLVSEANALFRTLYLPRLAASSVASGLAYLGATLNLHHLGIVTPFCFSIAFCSDRSCAFFMLS